MHLELGVHGIGRVHWACALGVHWVCIGIEGGMLTWLAIGAWMPPPTLTRHAGDIIGSVVPGTPRACTQLLRHLVGCRT